MCLKAAPEDMYPEKINFRPLALHGKFERVENVISVVNEQVVKCFQVVSWALDELTDIKSTDITRLPHSCLF